ncbi:MAG: phosphatase PAP2 family protein [Chlamydiota bacterium]
MMPFHDEQLNFMICLAKNRPEFLDSFFRFLNYFDTDYFYFLLIPFIWIGFSYRWGIRVFYLLAINALLNHFMKELFGWPRPSTDCPSIGMFHFKSFGFPSGAAQSALLLGGLLIHYWKTKASWILGSLYILLISFSRLYLGVHYPLDILGGWILGAILLFCFIRSIGKIEHFLEKQGLFFAAGLCMAIPLAILLIDSNHPKISYLVASFLGAGLGVIFSLNYGLYLPPPNRIWKGCLRAALAIGSLFLIFIFWPQGYPPFAKIFTLTLWTSLVASPLCRATQKILKIS